MSNPLHVVFWALFILAFFTLSRKSNLVVSGNKLRRMDVLVGDNGLLVKFRWTKTIQFGQRILEIPLLAAPESNLCPKKAYQNMITLVPAPKSGPAFVLPSAKGLAPVTYLQFQSFLRDCIRGIGLKAEGFSSHSFRRGGATWAFKSQVPSELIKVQGDWLSSAYMVYLEFSKEQRLEVSQRMIDAIANI